MIGLRLPKDETAQLDNWAKTNGFTRSEAIRAIIHGMIEEGIYESPRKARRKSPPED
jgi:metal-responsive CopG/Arc/MetJ family transcriptional regulator